MNNALAETRYILLCITSEEGARFSNWFDAFYIQTANLFGVDHETRSSISENLKILVRDGFVTKDDEKCRFFITEKGLDYKRQLWERHIGPMLKERHIRRVVLEPA